MKSVQYKRTQSPLHVNEWTTDGDKKTMHTFINAMCSLLSLRMLTLTSKPKDTSGISYMHESWQWQWRAEVPPLKNNNNNDNKS